MALSLPSRLKRPDALLGAWTGVVLLFLYVPIALVVAYSFNRSELNIRWEGFTLDWYGRLGADRSLVESVQNSLLIAAVTTVLSVLLGTGGAWLLHRYRFPMPAVLATLVFVPMIAPEVVMGVSLRIFFAVVNGAGNAGLGWLGVAGNPLRLGFTTVIVSHVTFCFPFVLIVVRARLRDLDPALEEAAMDLGATPGRAFFHVIVPYLLPAIVSGALLAFTLSLDELIVTVFTTGPHSQTLPVKIFGMARSGLKPVLNAVSTLFIAATVALVVAAEYVRKRSRLGQVRNGRARLRPSFLSPCRGGWCSGT